MRVLLASTAGAGHFGPLIPFAGALRRAGHEILVAAPISAQARVERAGLPFISFADPLRRELEPVWARARAAEPEQANEIVLGELFARALRRGTAGRGAGDGRLAARPGGARVVRVRLRRRLPVGDRGLIPTDPSVPICRPEYHGGTD